MRVRGKEACGPWWFSEVLPFDTIEGRRDTMLKACMINGFGWFEEERYRRSWLLFDEVEYLFPLSRVSYPPFELLKRPDFQLVQPESAAQAVQARVDRCRADCEDAAFRSAVTQQMSAGELRVAEQMVRHDDELRAVASKDPVFCVSYLIEKLLDHAEAMGSIPIVGRDYALEMIKFKLEKRVQTALAEQALVTTSQAVSLFAFQAGLSYRFLADADLMRVDINILREFKDENRSLLDRHHQHLLEVSQKFDGLLQTAEFAKSLAALRVAAEEGARSLDDSAKEAWRGAGLELAQKGAVALAAGTATALGILATGTLSSVLQAAAPAVMVGLGTAVSSAIGAVAAVRGARRNHLAYLMNARQYLQASNSTGAA
jgi:hypothetical protein